MESENTVQSQEPLNQEPPIKETQSPQNSSNGIGKKWNSLMIVGIALVVLGIFGGVYYLWKLQSSKPQYQPQGSLSNSKTVQPNLPSKKIDPATETETQNWKIYKNRDFTIKYPQDAKLENSTSVFDFLTFKSVNLFIIDHLPNVVDENFYQIQFAIIKDAQPVTADEIITKYIDANAKERKEKIMTSVSKYSNGSIDGLSFRDPGQYPNQDYLFIIAIKENNVFAFQVRGNNEGLNDKKISIANKILSTFSPDKTILPDKSLDQLIHLTLPEGWKLEKQDRITTRQGSGALVIKSADYDDKNPPTFIHENRPGSLLMIYKNYGGSIYSRDDKYKQIYDEIHDPNPAGATDHDLTKLTIGGYPAISYFYTFEGYKHTYNVWQNDNIWSIVIYSEKDKASIDRILSSITFVPED